MPMPSKPLANRKTEIELFRAMLKNTTETRILLIQASSGKGKTNLLENFTHECDGVCLVTLNCKNAEKGISEVFGVFRQELGADTFSQFNATYAQLRSSVNVAGNSAGGDINVGISSLLNVENEQTRQLNLARLEEAFFEDLHAVCQTMIVVIFDTFESAPSDLQRWLSGGFLRNAARHPHLRVVIGGQSVPEGGIEKWERACERRTLDDILDVDEWMEYVHARQWKFDRSYVQGIVEALDGFPRNVVLKLQAQAPRWK
jgi:hypothetical protein